MSTTNAAWLDAQRRYPADPVFPDGKPYSVAVLELVERDGISEGDACDVLDAELTKLGIPIVGGA